MDQQLKIDFALFLAKWLSVFHGSEEEFWRRQTPVKIAALVRALDPPVKKPSFREFLGV